MTDLSYDSQPALEARAPAPRRLWWLLPYACLLLAVGVGLYAGRAMGADSSAYEPALARLLRFMAAMKFAGVLAAVALTHWRLRSGIPVPLAAGYLGAVAVMALAAGLIWSLGGIAPGAVLFHVGLLVFLVLAWKDDGVRLPTGRGGRPPVADGTHSKGSSTRT